MSDMLNEIEREKNLVNMNECMELCQGLDAENQLKLMRMYLSITDMNTELTNKKNEIQKLEEQVEKLVQQRDLGREITARRVKKANDKARNCARDKLLAFEHEQMMWKDIEHLNSLLHQSQIELEQMKTAFFWKITKPARVVLDILKKLLNLKRMVKWLFKVIIKVAKKTLKRVDCRMKGVLGRHYYRTVGRLKWRLKYRYKQLIGAVPTCRLNIGVDGFLPVADYCEERTSKYEPLVSIIVPNYNHGKYLKDRLDSIYMQTYKNYEVILLDDCSTDNSRDILREYAEIFKKNTRMLFNKENAGSVFKQWGKGLEMARGELVWIAESDDIAQAGFLTEMVRMMKNDAVSITFSRSDFVKSGDVVYTTEDIMGIDTTKEFIITAENAVREAWGLRNIIPNVSSAVFRNMGKLPEDVAETCSNMRLCGDWLFYLSIVRGGCLAYTGKVTNYYRIHDKSTSLKVQKTNEYYKEFQLISQYIVENYRVDPNMFDVVKQNLQEHYKATTGEADKGTVSKYYSLQKINENAKNYRGAIVIFLFAMTMGGGETFPLYLANELRSRGKNVLVVNANLDKYDPLVRQILHPSVPLYDMKRLDKLADILNMLQADIVHSHHASVDATIAETLRVNKDLPCKHVISLHGMYETIDNDEVGCLIEKVKAKCHRFVYAADKNTTAFCKNAAYDEAKFVKIGNALPVIPINKVSRAELGIKEDAFVLCMVSRGIYEKGWVEAAEIVREVNTRSKREVHLVCIGDGEAIDEIRKKPLDYIHLMGTKNNVRDYYAMADIGFLPSKFKGESFPLVIIDCLLAGKPMIASDIGEIKSQLVATEEALAGVVVGLDNWEIPKEKLVEIIVDLAGDEKKYNSLLARVDQASKKFDIGEIAKQYEAVYKC